MTTRTPTMSRPRPAWVARAACRTADPDAFYPDKGETATEALAVCGRCPVTGECLAVGIDEQHGVWGGTTPNQRRALRRYDADGMAA